jgi:Family of unknown function (DUF5996)
MTVHAVQARDAWPSLPLAEWTETRDTLHMWTQIVGKVRLARTPLINHWWNAPLYVDTRGLTTSPIPDGARNFEITFDFVDHVLRIETSDGEERRLDLAPRSVADFYGELTSALRSLGLETRIVARPVEVETAIPFAEDETHRSYDAEHVARFWRLLVQAHRVLTEFRAGFLGKASPVHFFWGSFDLAASRFSGRTAPPHPGGVPNCPDYVMREAYSHEVSSAGWWPGGGPVSEPAFYAYVYPEPAGYADAPVAPSAAHYSPDLREFLLPYEAVRGADDPDRALLEFLQSTYEAAADRGEWDRRALERRAQ